MSRLSIACHAAGLTAAELEQHGATILSADVHPVGGGRWAVVIQIASTTVPWWVRDLATEAADPCPTGDGRMLHSYEYQARETEQHRVLVTWVEHHPRAQTA